MTLPDGKQLFMYTSVRKEAQPDGSVRDIQTQSLAVGDGMDYEKDVTKPDSDSGRHAKEQQSLLISVIRKCGNVRMARTAV